MPAKAAADDLQMVWMDRAKLSAYPSNPVDHPEEQVSEIEASIRQFGFINPIIVDSNNVIIAGHGRLLAAERIGLKKVRVIKVGNLTETQARALRVADNSISRKAPWNPAMLDAELAALRAVDFQIEPLGLDNIEIPEIDDDVTAPATKAERKKSTIFVSVLNADVAKATKIIAAALDKAKIGHNL